MIRSILSILAGISILVFILSSCGSDNPVEPSEEHFEAIGLFIIASGDTIVKYQGGTVTGNIEVAQGEDTALLSVKFIEEDGDVGLPPNSDWSLAWEVADTAVADVHTHQNEIQNYQFHIEGKAAGETDIKIIVNHFDHKDFESREIPVSVLNID
jgi:hypothetical protein